MMNNNFQGLSSISTTDHVDSDIIRVAWIEYPFYLEIKRKPPVENLPKQEKLRRGSRLKKLFRRDRLKKLFRRDRMKRLFRRGVVLTFVVIVVLNYGPITKYVSSIRPVRFTFAHFQEINLNYENIYLNFFGRDELEYRSILKAEKIALNQNNKTRKSLLSKVRDELRYRSLMREFKEAEKQTERLEEILKAEAMARNQNNNDHKSLLYQVMTTYLIGIVIGENIVIIYRFILKLRQRA